MPLRPPKLDMSVLNPVQPDTPETPRNSKYRASKAAQRQFYFEIYERLDQYLTDHQNVKFNDMPCCMLMYLNKYMMDKMHKLRKMYETVPVWNDKYMDWIGDINNWIQGINGTSEQTWNDFQKEFELLEEKNTWFAFIDQ